MAIAGVIYLPTNFLEIDVQVYIPLYTSPIIYFHLVTGLASMAGGAATVVVELDESDVPGAVLGEPLELHNLCSSSANVAYLSWNKSASFSQEGKSDCKVHIFQYSTSVINSSFLP